MASNAKPRQPRLRASCDGCFLAKVKCSKARPICSRCLACGIECRYSPSSRAGKPKADNSTQHHAGASHGELTDLSPIPDEKDMVFSSHPAAAGMYKLETGWNTPTSMDGAMSRNPSISSSLAMLAMDERAARHHDPTVEMYHVSMPWTPPTDLSAAPFNEMPMATGHMPGPHARSGSMDVAMSAHMASQWVDPAAAHEMLSYSAPNSIPTPVSMGSNYFPSPSATPNLRPAPPRHKSSPAGTVIPALPVGALGSAGMPGTGNSCTCFTVCLQSLQALHNASSPAAPTFDVVLSLNRKAVEGCAAMLGCPRCMNRSGTHTSAMLLATVIGKITSFYKHASQTYFEHGGGIVPATTPTQGGSPSTGLGVSLGAYTLGGEEGRWLEVEILNRELRKLEEVYAQFREVFPELSEDPEVSRAMIGYLGNTLGRTLDVVNHRKGDMEYV